MNDPMVHLGQIAYISSDRPNGPRFDAHITTADRDRYENLILLCSDHHVVVDRQPHQYSVERLRAMKLDHERWVVQAFEQTGHVPSPDSGPGSTEGATDRVGGQTAVVFVHGLFSSSKTWRVLRDLLYRDPDLAGYTLLPFDYPTPKFNFNPLRVIPDFDALARNFDTYLRHVADEYTDIIIVSHSQGGLIVQRYVAQLLNSGRASELSRIRRVIMLACPNTGSELFLVYRKALRVYRHPQERQLRPLDEQVRQARSVVINRAIHAREPSPSQQPLDVVVYAGLQDGIVRAASALDVFPEEATRTVTGDHFTIHKPGDRRHPTYATLKRDLVTGGPPPSAPGASTTEAELSLGVPPEWAWKDEAATRSRKRVALISLLLVALTLIASTAIIFTATREDGTIPVAETQTTLPSSGSTTSMTATTAAATGILDGACENAGPASGQQVLNVEICVIFWCKGSFHTADGISWVPDRGQIKIRPLILNKSPRELDVSIAPTSAVRLMISTTREPADWWQPPPVTAGQGDHPIAATWKEQLVWSIPPNAEGDAVRIDLPGDRYTWDGFATQDWDYSLLQPGQTAFKPLRNHADGSPKQEGDLVFDVPKDDHSRIVGLAVVDRNDPTRVLAFTPQENWPPPSDLNSF